MTYAFTQDVPIDASGYNRILEGLGDEPPKGAAADAAFSFARDHWATEEHIRNSGLRWTFLRDCLYLDLLQ